MGLPSAWTAEAAFAENIFVEGLCRSLKYEEVYLKAYESMAAARQGIRHLLRFVQRSTAAASARLPRPPPGVSGSPSGSPAWREEKALARADNLKHNKKQTWAGCPTLISSP